MMHRSLLVVGVLIGLAAGQAAAQAPPAPAGDVPHGTQWTVRRLLIEVGEDRTVLSGQLAIPAVPPGERAPAVLLVTGNGPHTREQTVSGSPMFRMISDYLVSKGIAVLSVDRRGYGFSGGAVEMQTTTKQLAADAQAWLEELRRQPEIDPAKVGVVGHSEGAMIAMMVAAEQEVGFIVLLAPPGEPCQSLWIEQKLSSLAAQGAEPATVEAVRAAFKKFTAHAARGFETDEAYYAGGKEVLVAHGVKETEATNEFVDRILSDLRTPWMQYFLGWDPAPWLERIDEPVLAIWGALDAQVPPARNKGLFERRSAEAGRAKTQTIVLEDEDHFFLRREGVAPGAKHSYGRMHVSPKLLEAAAEWISGQAAKPGEPRR